MDDSYSRLKTKVQKFSLDMMVMKAENEDLKKFKEEITLKQLEMERHVIAQQQMVKHLEKFKEEIHTNADGVGV